ncbi:oligosaccharide flippase family protein, partial [Akkermansiaceae bacterium]|nr:oligosaccharide flippase family protein [Akkermansiaceae bacterium]
MSIVRRIKINAGIGMIGGVVVILAAMGKAVILGRYLDLESFGYYVICLNAVSIIKLILSIGFEPTLLRFIPEFEAEKADHKVASLLVLLIYIASVISLLTIGLVFFGSDWAAETVYANPNLASSFKIMGFATCAHLFSGISVGLLR